MKAIQNPQDTDEASRWMVSNGSRGHARAATQSRSREDVIIPAARIFLARSGSRAVRHLAVMAAASSQRRIQMRRSDLCGYRAKMAHATEAE